ncbi:Alpha/Beta hydrolase protein [Desarmillaria tabescens]|uniref:Alpha/Beta hydrolase protein n=1 Tax=Armillaria tabescens TaxID=1929756 RepID=A0AA39JMA5_ARMTA|nr:Alpha/Beta hydrolase protein [Desarmillaria tabescens]KAK0443949.1 Alpha/Beta hydrolase protein [Desarmillaria tabescens]
MSAKNTLTIHPSLATVSQAWEVYPEDFYPGGSYAELPFGRTRYWLLGPEMGRKLVLIHGLSIPSIVWKDIAPQLAERGYRVLMYGQSSFWMGDMSTPNTTRFFADQFSFLMQHLNWAKAILIGFSMASQQAGGAVAAGVVYHFPHLVEDHIVLIAPAGVSRLSELPPDLKTPPPSMVHRTIPAVPSTSRLLPDPTSEIVHLQCTHLTGFNDAISSSYKEGPVRAMAYAYQSDTFNGHEVLHLHGTNDRVVAYGAASNIPTLLPDGAHVELVTIEGAGHDLTISQAKLVLEELDRFLPQPTV